MRYYSNMGILYKMTEQRCHLFLKHVAGGGEVEVGLRMHGTEAGHVDQVDTLTPAQAAQALSLLEQSLSGGSYQRPATIK